MDLLNRIDISHLGLFELAIIIAAVVLAGQLLRYLWKRLRQMKAIYDMARYRAARDDAYYTASAKPVHPQGSRHNHIDREKEEELYKDRTTRVHGMAEPKGFWTKLVMGEKMHIIREMIKIANSDEHRGYWQDHVEAQRRTEGQDRISDRER